MDACAVFGALTQMYVPQPPYVSDGAGGNDQTVLRGQQSEVSKNNAQDRPPQDFVHAVARWT